MIIMSDNRLILDFPMSAEQDARIKPFRDNSFLSLIKIANPGLGNSLENFGLEQQLIISSFTRTYNLKQLVYILSSYPVPVKNHKYILTCMKKEYERQMTRFSKMDGGMDAISYMDTYRLMEEEINSGFAGNRNISTSVLIHRIALEAFMIEKDFRFSKWDMDCQILSGMPLCKKRHAAYQERVKKCKDAWNKFEEDYADYIQHLNAVCDEGCRQNIFYICMGKKNIHEITYTDKVLKNTIQFYSFIQQNSGTDLSEFFMELFSPYAAQADLAHADMMVVSAHIRYFRLANIAKISLMADRMAMEYVFDGYDMIDIISLPLKDACNDVPELITMKEDEGFAMLDNDTAILLGEDAELDDIENVQLLYCIYLVIEHAWRTFEHNRNEKIEKGIGGHAIMHQSRKSLNLFDGYLDYYKNKSGYSNFINRRNGKLIDFPV